MRKNNFLFPLLRLFVGQVSPIIINTVITIQSALTPTAETPETLDSPVPVDLWEKRGWKELKFWFLEEQGDKDTASLAPLIPKGETLQVFGLWCDSAGNAAGVSPVPVSLEQVVARKASRGFTDCPWSLPAGQHQVHLRDPGGGRGTPHHPHAAGQVLLPRTRDKLVHAHQHPQPSRHGGRLFVSPRLLQHEFEPLAVD